MGAESNPNLLLDEGMMNAHVPPLPQQTSRSAMTSSHGQWSLSPEGDDEGDDDERRVA